MYGFILVSAALFSAVHVLFCSSVRMVSSLVSAALFLAVVFLWYSSLRMVSSGVSADLLLAMHTLFCLFLFVPPWWDSNCLF